MRRVLLILATAALMVVLMATTAASPAFAYHDRGYKCGPEKQEEQKGKEDPCPKFTATNDWLWGYGCGQKKFQTVYTC